MTFKQMKEPIILILTIISISCYSTKNIISISNKLPLEIDGSNFVKNLEYEKISYKKLSTDWRKRINIDRIEEKIDGQYLLELYLASDIKTDKNYSISFFYLNRNDKLPLDGYFEKYFLATINSMNKPISIIEIAAFESHPGLEIEKYCIVDKDLTITINSIERIEDFNSSELKENNRRLKYRIDENGKIKLGQ